MAENEEDRRGLISLETVAPPQLIERRAPIVTRAEFLALKDQVAALDAKLAIVTELTKGIYDLLQSFKLIAKVGKWIIILAGAVTATLTAIKSGMNIFKS